MAPLKHVSSAFLAFALGAAACQEGAAPQKPLPSPSGAPQATAEAPSREERSLATPPAPPAQPRLSAPAPPSPAPTSPAPKPADAPKPAPQRERKIAEVTIPEGAVLELELLTALDSAVSRAGDEIQARTISPVYVKGDVALPKGTYVEGSVTKARASGRVKGKSLLAFSFDRLATRAGTKTIATSFVEKRAESGRKKDATVIGGGAGLGALVGGILGGKKGAAIGAGIGGASGTGVVLATKGGEIKLPVGTEVNVRLEEAVKVVVN